MESTIAAEAVKMTAIMYRDNQLDDLFKPEREKQRKLVMNPLVNDYFAWIKEVFPSLPAGCATAKAINYSINLGKFLRVFLTNGNIPMDNNRAAQAIRPFTLGRKNWVNMNSIRGTKASTVLYSLVETAKANKFRIYDYLDLLPTELPNHIDDTNLDFMAALMPWSDRVQEKCNSFKLRE